MSALDREFQLKITEQEQQRAVLRSELDQVLKQLKFTQFECKDKLAEASTAVEEERRKTACAQAQHEKAKKQRLAAKAAQAKDGGDAAGPSSPAA